MSTANAQRVVSAPGKLMVMGEYSVLGGAPALVIAVNRRLRLRFTVHDSGATFDGSAATSHHSAESPTISPEIALALRLGRKHSATQNWNLDLDSTALHDPHGRKLGLGSSAAKAVASAAFVAQSTLADQVFPLALEAHKAVAPRGSGADVAASAHGGLIRFERDKPEGLPAIIRMALPNSLHWRAYFSGRSASTAQLIDQVSRYARTDAAGHRATMTALGKACSQFEKGCQTDSPALCIEAVRMHGTALRALGEKSHAPIVDDALEAVCRELPRGTAIKPSGAGGGDVSIAFFSDDGVVPHLDEVATGHGFTALTLEIDEKGPCFES